MKYGNTKASLYNHLTEIIAWFSIIGPYESGISGSSPISLKSGGKGEGVIPEVLIVFVSLVTLHLTTSSAWSLNWLLVILLIS